MPTGRSARKKRIASISIADEIVFCPVNKWINMRRTFLPVARHDDE
jgi:hypothetical protein